MVLHNLLALRSIEFDQIHGEAVSSVVPRLVSEYRHMFERYLDRCAARPAFQRAGVLAAG